MTVVSSASDPFTRITSPHKKRKEKNWNMGALYNTYYNLLLAIAHLQRAHEELAGLS